MLFELMYTQKCEVGHKDNRLIQLYSDVSNRSYIYNFTQETHCYKDPPQQLTFENKKKKKYTTVAVYSLYRDSNGFWHILKVEGPVPCSL